MTDFEIAWAYYTRFPRILLPNQQDFRHGYNAGLEVAAKLCEERFKDHYDHSARKIGASECAVEIRKLEVEVQT